MWLEVSSVSWFSDYQARRASIRYRPAGGGATVVCHTLNGSALAVPRVWAALVETYRQPDGSVALPPVLHPYLRGARGDAGPVAHRRRRSLPLLVRSSLTARATVSSRPNHTAPRA